MSDLDAAFSEEAKRMSRAAAVEADTLRKVVTTSSSLNAEVLNLVGLRHLPCKCYDPQDEDRLT